MSDKSFPQNPVELKVGPGQGPSTVSHVLSAESWEVAFPGVVSDELFLFQALYNQYIHFKETEIPAKEQEKGRIEELYKLLEVKSHRVYPETCGWECCDFSKTEVCSVQVYFGMEKWK